MRRCKKCGEMKPPEAFYRNAGGRDDLRPECKACTAARRKAWYQENRDREIQRVREWQQANREHYLAKQAEYRSRAPREHRSGHLRRKFGLTVAEYDAMLADQGGVCAICGRAPRPGKHLHVDHDHDTGRVRGLLCFSCNVAVGQLQHDADRIARAADYVDAGPECTELTRLARERVRSLARVGPD